MNRWLIVGDSSFTGKAFINYLQKQGESFVGLSLRGQWNWQAIIDGSWDYIVNFAALNVVAPSWDHVEDYYRVNVLEQIPLWEAMLARPPKRYVHVSTPEVYGDTKKRIPETYRHNPSTPYAASRSAAEQLLGIYHQQYNFPVVITRACNVYGPGQQLYRLIPRLIWHIKHGKRFPLEGGGMSQRAFVYIDDCVRALELVARNGQSGQAYHITKRNMFRILQVARLVCNTMGVKPSDVLDIAPDRPGKDATYKLDDSRLAALGWAPEIGIGSGILRVAKWMEDNWGSLKDRSTTYEFRP